MRPPSDRRTAAPRPTRAVFFDAGGTLIHPVPSVGGVYANVTAPLGARIEPDRFERVLYPIWADYREKAARDEVPLPTTDAGDLAMWRIMAERLYEGMPELRAVDFERWFVDVYEAFSSGANWRFFPEVEETISGLRARGISVGIVSNWSSRLGRILEDLAFHDRVDFAVISAVVGHRKPDPRIFEPALAASRAKPSEAIHVGDTYGEDVVGAERAGIRGLLVDRHGISTHGRPEITIPTLLEVLDHL